MFVSQFSILTVRIFHLPSTSDWVQWNSVLLQFLWNLFLGISTQLLLFWKLPVFSIFLAIWCNRNQETDDSWPWQTQLPMWQIRQPTLLSFSEDTFPVCSDHPVVSFAHHSFYALFLTATCCLFRCTLFLPKPDYIVFHPSHSLTCL